LGTGVKRGLDALKGHVERHARQHAVSALRPSAGPSFSYFEAVWESFLCAQPDIGWRKGVNFHTNWRKSMGEVGLTIDKMRGLPGDIVKSWKDEYGENLPAYMAVDSILLLSTAVHIVEIDPLQHISYARLTELKLVAATLVQPYRTVGPFQNGGLDADSLPRSRPSLSLVRLLSACPSRLRRSAMFINLYNGASWAGRP
jgi:hypothetical protein